EGALAELRFKPLAADVRDQAVAYHRLKGNQVHAADLLMPPRKCRGELNERLEALFFDVVDAGTIAADAALFVDIRFAHLDNHLSELDCKRELVGDPPVRRKLAVSHRVAPGDECYERMAPLDPSFDLLGQLLPLEVLSVHDARVKSRNQRK